MRLFCCLAIIIALFTLGCSGNAVVQLAPDINGVVNETGRDSHVLWGLWQGIINPEAGTIQFVELRSADYHLNALFYLEPPANLYVTVESVKFTGNIIDVDIGLRHPFLGLNQFTGFDVCGIFITKGSVSGFADAGLCMASEGDTRLVNADGYSRWWNPAEFPHDNTMFAYKDGLLGAPDSVVDFNATVNAYKYFCDDLQNPNDTLDKVTQAHRGMFTAGSKNVRHYTIQMGAGLVFNYAVDACWAFPQGGPPWTVPDDFGAGANRVEPWRIKVTEVKNSLWNDGQQNGGKLSLSVDVYDWFNAGLNAVRVESPGNFTMVESGIPIGGGAGFSTYEIDIPSATPAPNKINLLITVASEQDGFQGFIPGVKTSAYFTHTAPVSPVKPPLGYKLVLDATRYFDSERWDFAPSIITNPFDGYVYMGYCRYYNSVPNTTADCEYSEDSGESWVEDKVFSNWGTTVIWPFISTLGIDALGVVYQLANNSTWPTTSFFAEFVPGPQPPWHYGTNLADYGHGSALIFSHDGYPIPFSDYQNMIRYKRGTEANAVHPASGTSWSSIPKQTAVPAPARLSHTKNIVLDPSNIIRIVYFSSSNNTWIRIAYNNDSTIAANWKTMEVYDGKADGYVLTRDPSICRDADSDWHCAFIARDGTPNEYVLYMRSSDSLSWSKPVVAFTVPGDGILDDPTVDAVKVNGNEIVVITYQDDATIFLAYSWDEGMTWQKPAPISTGGDMLPDTCTTGDGFVHTVWEHDEGDDRRIEYIRAHFVEE